MSSVINDPLAKRWLDVLLKPQQFFASLHYEVPNPADPGASEIDGTTYARSPLQWDYVNGTLRTIWNIQDLTWLNLQTTTIVCVGVWTDPTKGDLLLWAQLDDPVQVPDRGSFKVDAHQLFVNV